MEIEDFIELNIGKWLSQRTSYHLDGQKTDNSKSEITIERLSCECAEVISLCQQHNINPTLTLGGTKTSWDSSVDSGQAKQMGSSILILIPDGDNPRIGNLLQMSSLSNLSPVGRYSLGNDEALTLTIKQDASYTEERLWFASPNLRLRTSLFNQSGGFSVTTFYSEIRRIPPKTD
jgi:phycoerythrin-associated linker protein